MPPPLDRSVWQSGAHLTVCRDNPLLRRTSIDIDAMIEEGRLLFAAKHRAGTVTAADYERFMASALRVGEDLRQFLGDTWNRLANIDPLTGLGNRAAMLRKLGVESERHVRNEEPCCVAILDLDHFKQINDTYGHSAGDVVLRSIASLLATSVRPYDEVFRYGGEEFVLCLPNADVRTAWAIVERLRLKVAGWAIPIRNGQQIYTTLSIGVAPLAGRGGVEAAIELADAALYAAKGNGRNCVFVRCE
jgi:diguanylate cyclase (GGDEF)-like protein